MSHRFGSFFIASREPLFTQTSLRCDSQGDSVEGGFLVDKKREEQNESKGSKQFQARALCTPSSSMRGNVGRRRRLSDLTDRPRSEKVGRVG